MKVLYYTNDKVVHSEIEDILIHSNAKVNRVTTRPSLEFVKGEKFDYLISDRSRFIIPESVIDALGGKVVNLHPSYLPFNRGDQPLLWAAVEGTPFGVTIHKVNEKFDEGPIICQTRLSLSDDLSLKEAYKIMRNYMVSLFETSWNSGEIARVLESEDSMLPNKSEEGSTRSRYQGRVAVRLLPFGWETTIKWLRDNREVFLSIDDKS